MEAGSLLPIVSSSTERERRTPWIATGAMGHPSGNIARTFKAPGMRRTEGALKKGEVKGTVIGRGHEGGEADVSQSLFLRRHATQTQLLCSSPPAGWFAVDG